MPHTRSLFFVVLLGVNSFAIAAEDDTQALIIKCPIPVPEPITLENPEQLDHQSILIESKKSYVEKNQSTRFSGGVKLASGDKKIAADEILVDRVNGKISATGNTRFQDNSMTINADSLVASSIEKKMILSNSQYQLHSSPGRGTAEELKISELGASLVDSSFTTCTEPVPDWQISASEINLSTKDNEGEAWNTVFRVKDVPVFYLPYFNFPLTDERKTGFLYPTISSSSSKGAEVGLPFYWNIAENMDATITPIHMSERGTQLNTEFRYLTGQQFGQIDLEYLDKDKELINNDDARYLARYQHAGTFAENYRVYVDYSDISDDNYLVDIGSKQFSKSEAYLWRIGELSYFSNNWHSTVKVQDFKVLGDNNPSYRTLPQLELDVYQPLGFLNSTFNIYSEYSHFDISNEDLPTADRLHVETGLSIPYSKPGWFINSDFRVMHTAYQQDNVENVNLTTSLNLTEEADRTLPKVRIHTGLNFDRDTSFLVDDMTQTFEPQIQYLYIPEKDQNDIFIYDTSPLQDDFDGLFRDRRFSGLDRIAEANQVSFGATTRILNQSNTELFHLSVGRIFYLDNSSISFDEEGTQEDSSALAADMFIQLARRWQFKSDIQYDTKNSRTDKSHVSIDYRKDNRNIFQLSHRYIENVSGVQIEQASALSSFPINKDWQVVGRVTHDLIRKRSLEAYGGVQYESCCWAIRFAVYRNINTNLDEQDFDSENRDEFDNGFMLQFVLKGLGGNQKPLPIDDMLESGIFGYKRPYFLSN
ncbi:LPS assembly protein LptD [Thalassotalea psychrophila]|uniref:LPS-assembly protein LptD n=1 Tax=Thalassotalea psychrophila TaxID=3065647 RepID=A0ABY9TT45_9GAMM|nr:LPS assembly protein LptD [Colwelliaceae bacterium SQ149]